MSSVTDFQLTPMTHTRRSLSQEMRAAESRWHELEAESLKEALPEGFNADTKELKQGKTGQPSPTHTILNIVNGALWGVLARKGLMVLTMYNGTYLGGVVWANFAACVVMGMAMALEKPWGALLEHEDRKTGKTSGKFAQKGTIPVYVGITTGFCGTCSSFSSFILEAFSRAANTLPELYDYPNAAYGIMEALAVLVAQLAISASGFHAGQHLMNASDSKVSPISPRAYKWMELACSVSGVVCYIIVIVLIATKNDGSWRSWTFLCLFAPWGALLRFWLLKTLNGKIRNFPVGTYTANQVGCLLLAVFTLLLRGRRGSVPIVSNMIGCHILVGLDDGFCGALTTVSTFVVELFGLTTGHSYGYGVASVASGFACMVLILGSYNWAVGLVPAVCL